MGERVWRAVWRAAMPIFGGELVGECLCARLGTQFCISGCLMSGRRVERVILKRLWLPFIYDVDICPNCPLVVQRGLLDHLFTRSIPAREAFQNNLGYVTF